MAISKTLLALLLIVALAMPAAAASITDFRLGVQAVDNEACNSELGPERYTQALSVGGGGTGATSDAGNSEPDCYRLKLDKLTGPGEGKDFRICYEFAKSGTSPKQCTPWASEGGGWGTFTAYNSNPNAIGVILETRVLAPEKIISDVRIDVQTADAETTQCNRDVRTTSTPALSAGGGWSDWAGRGFNDPNCIRFNLIPTLDAASATIREIRVSTATPAENQEITVWCKSSIPDADGIRVTSNDETMVFTAGAWSGDEQSFTASAGSAGAKNVICQAGDDAATAKTAAIMVRAIAPERPVLSGAPNCTAAGPYVNLTWPAARGAVKYNVYANDTLNATVNAENYTNAPNSWMILGHWHNWSVAGVNSEGVQGPLANITIIYSCPAPDTRSLDIPDRFTRAYFARAGAKNVTAFWTANQVTVIYQQLSTPMYRLTPSTGTYEIEGNYRQIVRIKPEHAEDFWDEYVRGLRLNRSAAGAPSGPVLLGVRGFRADETLPEEQQYTANVAYVGQYLSIWGYFTPDDNIVYLNNEATALTPVYQSRTQINVLLPESTPLGTVTVYVVSKGMRSSTKSIRIEKTP